MTVGRCRYAYETSRYSDLGEGCCWRPVWNDSDRCMWHADEEGKSVAEFASQAPEHGNRLDGAVFRGATLDGVEWFSATVLVGADFENSTVEDVDFSGSDLRDANFGGTSLRNSDFREANLEDATLSDADLQGADFEDARLHEVSFSGSYIGHQTNFGETVIYERELFEEETAAVQQEKFDAAAWTYRTLQFQFRENALLEQTTAFFVREKELRRRFAWQRGQYIHALRSEGSRLLIGYGYSIPRILGSALFVILLCALLYPFVGGVRDAGGEVAVTYALTSPLDVSLDGFVTVFTKSLYFSTISFTTLGAGDVVAVGFGARMLSGVEALLGYVLLAVFISVLTRRHYWL